MRTRAQHHQNHKNKNSKIFYFFSPYVRKNPCKPVKPVNMYIYTIKKALFGFTGSFTGLQVNLFYFIICILNNTFYIYRMDKELIEKVNNSGLKKNHIAKNLGIVPNHLYQCMLGNRRLSLKKQDALRKLLSTVN